MSKFRLVVTASEQFHVDVEAESVEAAEKLFYTGKFDIDWTKPVSGVDFDLEKVETL